MSHVGISMFYILHNFRGSLQGLNHASWCLCSKLQSINVSSPSPQVPALHQPARPVQAHDDRQELWLTAHPDRLKRHPHYSADW